MRLINLEDILKQFPKADFDGDDLENMKAYPHWKTDITGLFGILKSVPIIEPCENAISREDAINVAIDAVDEWDGGCNTNRATMISNAIKKLPSVKPQPFINKHCISEGVCHEDKVNVLKKIRAEIIELRSKQNVGVLECLDIIDEYIEGSDNNAKLD